MEVINENYQVCLDLMNNERINAHSKHIGTKYILLVIKRNKRNQFLYYPTTDMVEVAMKKKLYLLLYIYSRTLWVSLNKIFMGVLDISIF